MTPYNVPAFIMYRNAVAPTFKLEWEVGERKMLIISVGTGSSTPLGPGAQHPSRSVFEVALGIAGELMNGVAYDQDINCRMVGRCVFGPPLDREVGTLVPDAPLGLSWQIVPSLMSEMMQDQDAARTSRGHDGDPAHEQARHR
jgi:uncharacterized protein